MITFWTTYENDDSGSDKEVLMFELALGVQKLRHHYGMSKILLI